MEFSDAIPDLRGFFIRGRAGLEVFFPGAGGDLREALLLAAHGEFLKRVGGQCRGPAGGDRRLGGVVVAPASASDEGHREIGSEQGQNREQQIVGLVGAMRSGLGSVGQAEIKFVV